MNNDKKKLYAISVLIFVLLLIALFVDFGSSKIVAACLILLLTGITCLCIKKRSSVSINKKEVLLLLSVIAIIYVVLIQMSQLIFQGYRTPYNITLETSLKHILPTIIVIVGIEIIRFVLVSQKNRFVNALVLLSSIWAEVLLFASIREIVNFNFFMDMVGLTLFPAICANIFYQYVAKRYGVIPNIVFRLITTLYIYLFKTVPDIPDALFACVKMLLPLALMALLSAMFSKQKKNATHHGGKLSAVALVMSVVVIASVAMLISCRFRFGALVIATESMTGEINKGDMIVYERYDDQDIKVGQVVVFTNEQQDKIIHRVVEIQNIGGELRYYTKGDANEDLDEGYRVDSDIVGLSNVKIAFLGYPTLWLREIIKN